MRSRPGARRDMFQFGNKRNKIARCTQCSRVFNLSKSRTLDEKANGTLNTVLANKITRSKSVDKWADDVATNGIQGRMRGVNLQETQNEIDNTNQTGQREGSQNREEEINGEGLIIEEDGGESVDEDETVVVAKTIRLTAWNSEGLFEKLGLNGVCEYISSFDIACLGETFTFSSFDFNVKFGDFIALHSPAKKFNFRGRPSGGLVVLIRKSLERFISVIDTKISHVICFKIAKELLNTARDILYIGSYVHPPDSVFYTDEDYECTLEALEQFMLDQLEEDEEYNYIIAGDLNARISDWGLKTGDNEDEDEEGDLIERTAQDSITNENGHKLIQLCTAFNVTPINGIKKKNFDDKFTFIGRRGCSTIDHFVCSADLLDKIDEYKTGNRVESQHMPIEMTLKGDNNTRTVTANNDKRETTKVKWNEAKKEECINILNKPNTIRKIQEATELLDNNIEEGMDKFDNIMKNINKPMRSTFRNNGIKEERKKWFDKDCEAKKKAARQALTEMSRINGKKKKDEYKRAKEKYLDKRIEYQKFIRERRKQYKKEMQEKLVNSRHDTKAFWKEVRKISYRKQKLADISINQWGDHFTNVFNPEGEVVEEGINLVNEHPLAEGAREQVAGEGRAVREEVEDSDEEEELDEEILREEIIGGIDRLKKGKAGGLDEVSPELIQTCKGRLIEFFYKLFNKLFNTSYFPINWAAAIVVPLYKKGDANVPDNYRGISLLSITSKIFTGILNKRLYNWAEENEKINIEQAGFRRSHSTIDHIYTLHSMISNCLYGRRRSKFYVCFVDFKKAFDTVKRDILWEVLSRHGISNKMLNMLKAIYRKVTAVVRYGNELTGEINCPLGVRQGCQLSPLLFTLLVAELAQGIARDGRHGYQFNPGAIELFTLLFADDIALTATTPAGLQTQINLLKRGAERLGLVVNLEKTKVMVFRKGGFLGRLEKWFYGEDRLEVVNKYKYLGYTLTTKLSVDIALSEYAGKAKGRIVSIFRALYRLGKIDLGVFFKLFDSQVKPILLYGAEIWGIKRRDIIEKVHLFACKKLLGVSVKTPNAFIYFELNRYPLFIDARVKVYKYWLKLLSLEDSRLPKQAYIRELRELNKENGWGKLLQEHLTINGFRNIWEDQDWGLAQTVWRGFKQREIDNFWQNEHVEMEESRSRRFTTYLSFKEGHDREAYLGEIRVPKFRRALTRFRFGVNELRANRRYTNIQANRQCPFCLQEENELHFLVRCPTYTVIRQKYISKFWITLNGVTLKDLVNNVNIDITRNVATYIYYAMMERNRQ